MRVPDILVTHLYWWQGEKEPQSAVGIMGKITIHQ